jgi:nucleotidyltransferase substrate binding protein (TIGR01987 family)
MTNNTPENKVLILSGKVDITYLDNAIQALSRSLHMKKDEYVRDSCIQRFEFSIELLWKTLKKVLSIKGYDANSPRDTFRLSAKVELIEDPKIWFDYLEMRNNTSHTYKEAMAEEIYQDLPAFLKDAQILLEKLKKLEL